MPANDKFELDDDEPEKPRRRARPRDDDDDEPPRRRRNPTNPKKIIWICCLSWTGLVLLGWLATAAITESAVKLGVIAAQTAAAIIAGYVVARAIEGIIDNEKRG